MESVPVLVLVFVLVVAIVAAMIAFVVLPAMAEARSPGEGLEDLDMGDYVADINLVNKAGHEYDMEQDAYNKAQDERLDALEASSVVHPFDEGPGGLDAVLGGVGSVDGAVAGAVLDGALEAGMSLLDSLEITPSSEEGGVSTLSLGPLSAPADLSQVCFNDTCLPLGGLASGEPAQQPPLPVSVPAPAQPPAQPPDLTGVAAIIENGAAQLQSAAGDVSAADTGEVESGGTGGVGGEVDGFAAWPASSGMFRLF